MIVNIIGAKRGKNKAGEDATTLYYTRGLKDTKSKCWFVVIGNPQLHFLNDNNESKTPQEICEEVVNQWCGNDENKSGACVYSISAKGYIHLHSPLLCVRLTSHSSLLLG